MTDAAADMIAKLEQELAGNIAGVSEMRFADGRSIKKRPRQEIIDEINYWKVVQDPGLKTCRMRCRGDH